MVGPSAPNPTPEIPDIRKPDFQMLLQDLAQSRRDLYEERRHSEKRVHEERERSEWRIERLRTDLNTKTKDIESQNDALVRTLGRYQAENERLREELALAKVPKTNGHATAEKPAEKPEPEVPSVFRSGPPPVGLGPTIAVVLPQGPSLGKVDLQPPKL